MPSTKTALPETVADQQAGALGDFGAAWKLVNAIASGLYKFVYLSEPKYGLIFGQTNNAATLTTNNAAIAAAWADVYAFDAGVLVLPAGDFSCSQLPQITPKVATGPLRHGIMGYGSTVSRIFHYGTSEATSLKISNPGFNPSPNQISTHGAPFGFFSLDGAGSSGGACGIIAGDVSYLMFTDVACSNFTTGDGWKFFNGYGWCEGLNLYNCSSEFNAVQCHWDVGSGRQLATVSTQRTAGTAYTTIPCSALSEAVSAGQQLVIAAGVSAIGVYTATVTVAANAAAGATSITVNSFTPTTTIPASTGRVYFGGYGSFDYATFHSFYMQGTANQHGFVSEASRGLNNNIQRIGSRFRVTGNFRAGATNTGKAFWIKGDDTFSDTDWTWNIETGGTGVAHQSIRIEPGNGSIAGQGILSFYGFTTATFGSGVWQCQPSGMVCIQGISDLSSTTTFRNMRSPGFINVNGGVTPSGYPTSFATASPWQNTTGYDLMVYLTFTGTAAGTISFNSDVWGQLPASATMWTIASGQKITISFPHYQLMWARVDFTGCTLSVTRSALLIN